jgi:CII-binding regulator of phage lambda lysogenization HflD
MTLDQIIQMGVPSAILAVLGFLAKAQFADIKGAITSLVGEIKALNQTVGGHAEKLASYEARLVVVEREITSLRDRQHALGNEISGVKLRRSGR